MRLGFFGLPILLFIVLLCPHCSVDKNDSSDDDDDTTTEASPTPWPTDDDTVDDDTHDDDTWGETYHYPLGETSISYLSGTLAIAYDEKCDGYDDDYAILDVEFKINGSEWQTQLWDYGYYLPSFFNELAVYDDHTFLAVFDRYSETALYLISDEDWIELPCLESTDGPLAVARDGAGTIHIAHIRVPDYFNPVGYEQAEYSVQTETGWDTEVLIPVTSRYPKKPGDNGISLALDSADRSHLALWSGGNITYWLRTDGAWQNPEIVSFGALARTFSVKLNSAEDPSVVYCNIDRELEITRRGEDGWHSRLLPAACGNGRYGSVLDQDDVLHLAYVDGDGSIAYGSVSLNETATWQTEIVDSNADYENMSFPFNVSLALDDSGFAHLTYHNRSQVLYATNQEGPFTIEIVYQGDSPDE